MKRFPIAAGLLGLLLLTGGCEGSPAGPGPRGELRGMMDGDVWVGTAETDLGRDTLVIWSQRTNVPAEHSLVITFVETAPGVYTLVTEGMSRSAASGYRETVGGDVAVYRATATSGSIHFSELDRSTGRASGTVELTLQGPRGTSRFVQGQFDAIPFTPRQQN